IRDDLVTGVQTCALPISRSTLQPLTHRNRSPRANQVQGPGGPEKLLGPSYINDGNCSYGEQMARLLEYISIAQQKWRPVHAWDRSEERRVGRACTSLRYA